MSDTETDKKKSKLFVQTTMNEKEEEETMSILYINACKTDCKKEKKKETNNLERTHISYNINIRPQHAQSHFGLVVRC